MRNRLAAAIHGGEIVVHYQPVVDLSSDRIVAVEGLARWQHPERGLVMPGQFVETAERTRLIDPLTSCVLDAGLQQLADWQRLGLDLVLCVNVSVRSLLDDEFSDRVARALFAAGISPRHLKLEITERTVMPDPRRALVVLERLADMGVRLSIDDFGTGYSSPSYLRDLPVDEVKIDQSFVTGMSAKQSDEVIVRSTIDLCHELGLEVVAEGIEKARTRERLCEMGCDRGQGHVLSPPLPPRQLTIWMHMRSRGGAPLAAKPVAGVLAVAGGWSV